MPVQRRESAVVPTNKSHGTESGSNAASKQSPNVVESFMPLWLLCLIGLISCKFLRQSSQAFRDSSVFQNSCWDGQ